MEAADSSRRCQTSGTEALQDARAALEGGSDSAAVSFNLRLSKVLSGSDDGLRGAVQEDLR
jgi:hypothetical protein